MKKYIAELFGTFVLVLFGCGSVAVAGDNIGIVGIALAFGFAIVAMAYTIGNISGCHINPAVSLGMYFSGRLRAKDLLGYIISQFGGAIAASIALAFILKSKMSGYDVSLNRLGQNGWGIGYLGEYNLVAALLYEFIATLIFVTVILESTKETAAKGFAGLAIGITLIAIHLFGIEITGTSVNPARSFGPALLVGGKALSQVWLFLVIPSIAGILAGIIAKPCTCKEKSAA